jgi:hypothetical protein
VPHIRSGNCLHIVSTCSPPVSGVVFIARLYFITRLTRWVPLVEQELLTVSEHLSSPPVFSGVGVTRSLVVCLYFVSPPVSGVVFIARLYFLCYIVFLCLVCIRPVSCVPSVSGL